MKNSILTMTLAVLVIGTMLTNCQSNTIKEDMTQAKANKYETNTGNVQSDSIMQKQDSITAYNKFIQESETQIEVYEKNIAELKLKISEEKKEEKIKNEEKLAKLEMKNNELKNKVINYKNEQVDNWKEKQLEFKKDLDTLGSAIADFFVSD